MGNTANRTHNQAYDVLGQGWNISAKQHNMTIWKNQLTGEEIEEHLIETQDARDYLRHKQVYNYRFESETLVASKYWRQQISNDICAPVYRANLYLERVPRRLKNINILAQKDILAVYIQSFKGFRNLYEKLGSFNISEDMICFNQSGSIKVWINPDLTSTQPLRPHYGSSLKGEMEMIMRIVQMISRKSGMYQYIGDYILLDRPQTFEEAIQIVEHMDRMYQGFLPPREDLPQRIRAPRDLRWRNKKNMHMYHSHENSLIQFNSEVSSINKSCIQNQYIGPIGYLINNNINMSIPGSQNRLNNPSSLTAQNHRTNLGTDIRGNPILPPNDNHLKQQQRTNLPQSIIKGSPTSTQRLINPVRNSYDQNNTTRLVQQSLGVGASNTHLFNPTNAFVNRPLINQTSRSPSTIGKSSIVGDHRTSPINGRFVAPIVSGSQLSAQNVSNRIQHVGYNPVFHSELPHRAETSSKILGGLQQVSNLNNYPQSFGSLTQVYKESAQAQSKDVVNQVVGANIVTESPEVVEAIITQQIVIQQKNQIVSNQNNQSIPQNNQVFVNRIPGQSVGRQGFHFQSGFVPVSSAVPNVINSTFVSTGPISQSSVSNTMARIREGAINRVGVEQVNPQIIQTQGQVLGRQPNQRIQIIESGRVSQNTPVPVTLANTETERFDFSKVGDSNQYTSPEIRALLTRQKNAFEPVFKPDVAAQDSPIKRTQIQNNTNINNINSIKTNNNPNPNIQSNINSNIQTNIQQKIGEPINNPYFNRQAGIQIPQTPQSHLPNLSNIHTARPQNIHQAPQPNIHYPQVSHQGPIHGLPHINQTRIQTHPHIQQGIPQATHNLRQQAPQQFIHQQIPPQPIHQQRVQPHVQTIDPRFQNLNNHTLGTLQTQLIPGGMPFVPPQMIDMINMAGMMGAEGAVIMQMQMVEPVIDVGVDQFGNQYVQVDVGMLPMMMGMGMPNAMQMGPIGMPIGMPIGGPMMMGVAPMVIVQQDLEELSPEMMLEMMGAGAPTRVVRGPTGRLVQVQVPEQRLVPESFPPLNAPYAGNVYQQPGHHYHNHHQVSTAQRQEQQRQKQLLKEKAEQERLYADYQAKVQALLDKRQQLVEQQQVRRSGEQDDDEIQVVQNVEIHETVHTITAVDHGNGNIVETHTTQEVVIDNSGGGSYNYEQEVIEHIPQHQIEERRAEIPAQNTLFESFENQRQYPYNQQQEQKTEQIHTTYNNSNTPAQQSYQIYQAPNLQRTQSNSSRGSAQRYKLNQGVISEPLSFSFNRSGDVKPISSAVKQEVSSEVPESRVTNNYQYNGYSSVGGSGGFESQQKYQPSYDNVGYKFAQKEDYRRL